MAGSRTLRDDIDLLGGLLGAVIQAQEPMEAFALEERARALGKALRSGEEDAREQLTALVAGLSIEQATVLVRAHELLPARQPRRGQRTRASCPRARARGASRAPSLVAARGDRDHRRSWHQR